MKLLEALDRFVMQQRANGRAANTWRAYARHVRLLARWIATSARSDDVGEIDHETIALFLASPHALAKDDGALKKASTTNAIRSSMKAFFGYVEAAGLAPVNAARLVRRARCGAPPPRGLNTGELTRLRATLDASYGAPTVRDRALIEFLVGTGARLSSALAVDIADIDLDAGELMLRRTKGDAPQRVFLSPAVCALLQVHIGTRSAGPLFRSSRRTRLAKRHAQARLSYWFKRAGLRACAHSLRHAFATALYARTHDVLVVKAALGHRSLAATMVYAQCDDERLREVMSR